MQPNSPIDEHLHQIEAWLQSPPRGFHSDVLASLSAIREQIFRLEMAKRELIAYTEDSAVRHNAQIAALTAQRDHLLRFRLTEWAAMHVSETAALRGRIASLEAALRETFGFVQPPDDDSGSTAWDRYRVAIENARAALGSPWREYMQSDAANNEMAAEEAGSPLSEPVEPSDSGKSGLIDLIRAAIDGYHHVAHCVECGEMSVSHCTEGQQAEAAVAALEAALPICTTPREASSDKGLPE